jgi:hypothetical protein
LFQKVGDHIHRLGDLRSFNAQDIANIVWAYATAGVQHPALFEKVGDHVVGLDHLKSFKPQELSNTVWAYATAGVQHPALFNKVGNHVVELDNLKTFKPQELANTLWAYGTSVVQHPDLFQKIGDHMITLDNLKSFSPQDLANTVWAYATVYELRSDLFEKIGNAVANRGDYRSFHQQALTNIAWAYTVANADAPTIFNNTFTDALLQMQHQFISEDHRQLYQWHLWQTKELSHAGLPEELRDRCYQAFTTADVNVSRFRKDVVRELISIDLNPVEEYQTPSGYSIDALVEVNGKSVGVEVDGPSHFIYKKPSATTMLKRRQITAIDKIPLMSVPYWEWDKLGKDHGKKQQYLQGLLEALVSE